MKYFGCCIITMISTYVSLFLCGLIGQLIPWPSDVARTIPSTWWIRIPYEGVLLIFSCIAWS